MRHLPLRVVRLACLTILASSLGTASVARADSGAVPQGPVLKTCYSKEQVRFVNGAADCKKEELFVSWNQQGLKGDPGPQGPKGDSVTIAPHTCALTDPIGIKVCQQCNSNPNCTTSHCTNGTLGGVEIRTPTHPDPLLLCNGAQGPQGSQGATGATGPPGPAGPQGDSVAMRAISCGPGIASQICQDCNSRPLCTDKPCTTDNVGGIRLTTLSDPAGALICNGARGPKGDAGPTGPAGESVTVAAVSCTDGGAGTRYCQDCSSRPLCADRSCTTNNVGGVRLTTLSDPVGAMVCNGAAGARGATGPQGDVGPQGLKGDTGPAGPAPEVTTRTAHVPIGVGSSGGSTVLCPATQPVAISGGWSVIAPAGTFFAVDRTSPTDGNQGWAVSGRILSVAATDGSTADLIVTVTCANATFKSDVKNPDPTKDPGTTTTPADPTQTTTVPPPASTPSGG